MRLHLSALLTVVVLAGCSTATQAAGTDEKLAVVATTTQVADFTRRIGGDRVVVTQILKPNVDPHDYEPAAADIAALGRTKLLVKNGAGLEHFLDGMVEAAGFTGTVVDTSAGVAVRGEDPHIWHDPRNAKIMVRDIEQALAAADPAGRVTYEENLAAYSAQLDTLDTDIAAQIGALPAGDRKMVTNHDAFEYYIQRYGLQFVGSIIPSFDTSAELSAQDVDDIVAKIKATGTKAVFSESSLPPRTAEAIARQAGVRVVAGEDALYGDTLGPEGSDGDTYLKMMRHNTATIVRGLGG